MQAEVWKREQMKEHEEKRMEEMKKEHIAFGLHYPKPVHHQSAFALKEAKTPAAPPPMTILS